MDFPELDLLIEIHFENGFLNVENRFWISCFTENSEFPISKSKSRFATVKHPDFSEHGVFFLIGLDLLSTQFLSSHVENGGRAAVNLELNQCRTEESVCFDNIVVHLMTDDDE